MPHRVAPRGAAVGAVRASASARLRVVDPPPPLRVVDVALFYGERSGGIRSYLDAKAHHFAWLPGVEHHVVVPGRVERHDGGRHELPSPRPASPNGYRLPPRGAALERTVERLHPDVVLLHDPFWRPLRAADAAHRVGATVVAVHHGSSRLDAAALPGPSRAYAAAIRAWLRRAYRPADVVMSAIDPVEDCGRRADLRLRLGVDAAFRPQPASARGDETLYVGRLAREKGVFALLQAAALADDPWPLRFVGAGPAEGALRARAQRLGIAHRVGFSPFVAGRPALARRYAAARCVVMPGEHETFGLVALEAAACGAPVACCRTAPAAAAIGRFAHTFAEGDVAGLAGAVEAARAAWPDPAAAAELGWRHRWSRVLADELAALRRLAGR